MRNIPTMQDNVTSLSALYFNEIPDEMENLITSSGQTLSPDEGPVDLFQLAKAMAIYASSSDFYTTGGSANNYVLTSVSPLQSPTEYINGMQVRFSTINPNTGPSTVNVNALGSVSIRNQDGSTLGPQQLYGDVILRYSSSTSTFILISPEIPAGLPQAYWGSTIPNGYMAFDGSAINSSEAPALAAVYGANMPDLRGEIIRGLDMGRGVDNGRTVLSSQTGQLESHTHNNTLSSTNLGTVQTQGAGSHSHTRGTMNITGDTYWRAFDTINNTPFFDVSGAYTSSAQSGPERNFISGSESLGARRWNINFDASRTWSGSTSTQSNHVHDVSLGTHNHVLTNVAFGGNETRMRNVAFMYITKKV